MGFASASQKVNTIDMATQEWTVGDNKTYKCLGIANILLFLPRLLTKKAIYAFLHSTKTHINSERKLGLWFEESAYASASQRQPLCGSLPLSLHYKTLSKVCFTVPCMYRILQSECGFRGQHRQANGAM